MLLHQSTWIEIGQFLERSRTVVIPIGSNEQHGPTGLLGTDWMCPEIIAHEAQKNADILIGPTFNIGMAQHHLGFSGTISLRPSTFIAAIGDWVRSLAGHGFDKILFLNGHGGNIATIEAAFSGAVRRSQLRPPPDRVRIEVGELVGPGRRQRVGAPPVPGGPWQPCHAIGNCRDAMGLPGGDQVGRLFATNRQYRADPRSPGLPGALPGRAHGLGPGAGDGGERR